MIHRKYRAPVKTAFWMIGISLVCGFIGGAGAGTVFDSLARLIGAIWSSVGWVAVIVAVAILCWVAWSAFRAGDLGRTSKELNG